ncbi:MAG: hypothetical protein P0Y56_12425 [Candidatus Andeanibacterium colombiense]|uniref:Uncharacterized protein n=1 Tax=Candidatus Andeanibacterium colombiense TaxID=3121345 RepID=A0AAJ5X589_9SPHN|nr:MAG: hypothetical protein P0Y56_12425 [Sphingomonadaceae bacterium]
MKRLIPLLALLAAPVCAQQAAPAPQLDLEETSMLRCSAVFAIVAGDQQRGDPNASTWPPLAARGKEYFVVASARLIEKHQFTHEQVQALLVAEAGRLQHQGAGAKDPRQYLASLMQPCMLSLEASGL